MQAHAFFNPFADLGDSFDSQEGVLGFCAELDFFKKFFNGSKRGH
jgi:hypothetical protein